MSTMSLEGYMALPYVVNVVPDVCTDGTQCYLADNPELPGCMSHGATVEEAIRHLEGARRLYIRSLLKRNIPVPLPQAMADPGITIVAIAHPAVQWRVVTSTDLHAGGQNSTPRTVLQQSTDAVVHMVAATVS